MMNKGNFSNRKETEYPGQLHFHYNREERYKTLSPEVVNRDAQKKGIFRKRSRALIILFLDILLLLVLYFVVVPLITRYAKKIEFMGYEMQLRAFLFEDKTLLSLQIEAKEDAEGGEQNLVTVRYSVEGSDATVEVVDILPERNGEIRKIRGSLSGGMSKKKAFADVEIRGSTQRVKTDIIPEQE